MTNIKRAFTIGSTVNIKYMNYKGEIRDRNIVPLKLWYGNTEFHPELQFILTAFDLDKKEYRDFALSGFIF